MVTRDELNHFDADDPLSVGSAWVEVARGITDAAEDLRDVSGELGRIWHGAASLAASQELEGLIRRTNDLATVVKQLDNILFTYSEQVSAELYQLRGALDWFARNSWGPQGHQLVLNSDNSITVLVPDPNGDLAAACQPITDTIRAAVRDASAADDKATTQLDTLIATGAAGSQGGHPTGADVTRTLRGKSPAEVAAWWQSLSPATQQYITDHYPQLIGPRDGIPVVVRDEANRTLLDREIARTTDKGDKKALEAIRDRLNKATSPFGLPEQNGYLLKIGGDRQVIFAVGNPDWADNVLTWVPGTKSRLDNAPGNINRTDLMVDDAGMAAPSQRTAAVMWLGYDAPQDLVPSLAVVFGKLPDAAKGGAAERGAPALLQFQQGLRVTQDGDPSHNTVMGHSYGSTVIGVASRDPAGISADEVVFAASPGVRRPTAADVHGVTPDHVWASTAAHDRISLTPDFIHGGPPTESDFGARIFTSDKGPLNPIKAHGSYWSDHNAFRDNLAYIVTHQYGKVEVPPPDQTSFAPPPPTDPPDTSDLRPSPVPGPSPSPGR